MTGPMRTTVAHLELFYFSGTGNCLAVARAIAAETGGTAVSIADAMRHVPIATETDTVIIVFPAYLAPLYGVPLIVERFIRNLRDIHNKRLFAVCVCGGYEIVNALPPLKSLARLVRSAGGKLRAEYSLRLPMNNLNYDHIPVPIERDSEVIIRKSESTIRDISKRIVAGKRGKRQAFRSFVNLLLTPMNIALAKTCMTSLKGLAKEPKDSGLGFRELMSLTDRSISVDDNCNGCGTCSKVCPVGNIKMVVGKPEWQHRCEMCFACDEWCPRKAIHHWGRPNGAKYHHPSVSAKDLYVKA